MWLVGACGGCEKGIVVKRRGEVKVEMEVEV